MSRGWKGNSGKGKSIKMGQGEAGSLQGQVNSPSPEHVPPIVGGQQIAKVG